MRFKTVDCKGGTVKKFAIVLLAIVTSVCVAAQISYNIGDTIEVDPENGYRPVIAGFGPTQNWVEVSPSISNYFRWGNDYPEGYGIGSTWLYLNDDGQIVAEYNSLETIGRGLYLVDLNASGFGPYGLRIVNRHNVPRTAEFRRILFPVDESGKRIPFVNNKLTFVYEIEPCEEGVGNLEIFLVYGQEEVRIGGIDHVQWSANNDGFVPTSSTRVVGTEGFAFIAEIRIDAQTGQLRAYVRRSTDLEERWRWIPLPLPGSGG